MMNDEWAVARFVALRFVHHFAFIILHLQRATAPSARGRTPPKDVWALPPWVGLMIRRRFFGLVRGMKFWTRPIHGSHRLGMILELTARRRGNRFTSSSSPGVDCGF